MIPSLASTTDKVNQWLCQKSIAKFVFLLYSWTGENAELLHPFPLHVSGAE